MEIIIGKGRKMIYCRFISDASSHPQTTKKKSSLTPTTYHHCEQYYRREELRFITTYCMWINNARTSDVKGEMCGKYLGENCCQYNAMC